MTKPLYLLAILVVVLFHVRPSVSAAQQATVDAPRYREAADVLAKFIQKEIDQKDIRSFAIAVVDDQQVIWAQGFGHADKLRTKPASPSTIYRVGSVSKLLSDLAVVKLIDEKKLDLDADIREILPDFHPKNPFDQPITLRRLMSHQSGLVREAPVGNYFDNSHASLEQTVASLNNTTLVFEPGTQTKYSNAAVAVAGYCVEKLTGKPFSEHMRETLLEPLGMTASSYTSSPEIESKMAYAEMWSYDGRRFDAPNLEMGCVPAGNLYSSVLDLSQFMKAIFGNGVLDGRQIIAEDLLNEMLQVTPTGGSSNRNFGIGFMIGELDGIPTFEHNGAIYGFATDFRGLRQQKLGVMAVASLDVANGFVSHVTEEALRLFLAAKQGNRIEKLASTTPVDRSFARSVSGIYANERVQMRLAEQEGRLMLQAEPLDHEIRKLGDRFVFDNVLSYGRDVKIGEGQLQIGDVILKKKDEPIPDPVREKWSGLIGEYGWDYNTLFIYEDRGQLWTLIEWVYRYPIKELDDTTFAFPNYGLYSGEKLVFTRDREGQATQVVAAEVKFPRRNAQLDNQSTYKITPQLPATRLREIALAAEPPQLPGNFLQSDLVEIIKLDPTIKLDIRYATDNNFMGMAFYEQPRAYLQRPAAEAVVRANRWLHDRGYGLLIHDAYRPWYVTKMFWDATPLEQKRFVADPDHGSRHNRGCAVDLTLYDLATGKPVTMVSGYDEFSERAYPNYPGGTSQQRWLRQLLRDAMEQQEFEVYEYEWWHFDYKLWNQYPVMNTSFEAIHDAHDQ